MSGLTRLAERYGVLRAVKFGVAGIIGFAVAEAIIIVGLFLIDGTLELPSGYSSSPSLLAVDIVAFVIGVTVGFFVNERTTVKDAPGRESGGSGGTAVRLVKYQGVYVVGNAITIGTQLVLLAAFALSPAIGVLVGAVVAYPVSYVISMRFVWKV
jgi:putative flippase GtrA